MPIAEEKLASTQHQQVPLVCLLCFVYLDVHFLPVQFEEIDERQCVVTWAAQRAACDLEVWLPCGYIYL